MSASRTASRAASRAASFAPGSRFGGSASAPVPELLWWPADEGSGTTIAANGVGPAGTAGADVWTLAGSPTANGNSHGAVGSAPQISSNSNIAFATNQITATFWANRDIAATQQLVGTRQGGTNPEFQALEISGVLNVRIRQSGLLEEEVAMPALDTWVHYAITFDSPNAARGADKGVCEVWYDAVKQTTTNTSDTKTASSDFTDNILDFGNRSTLIPWRGMICDLRIFNRILSQAEIAAIYADTV